MSEKVKVELYQSEIIRLLECLALDNFDKNRGFIKYLMSHLNINTNETEFMMGGLEYFTNELMKIEKRFE